MPKNVLITGGSGFLGGHIASEFAKAGWRVTGLGRSRSGAPLDDFSTFQVAELTDLSSILRTIESCSPDVVIHLAAPASVASSLRDPLADFQAHLAPTATLLEGLRLSRAGTRLVHVSSAAVYGNPAKLPVDETTALRPISPYGFHKMQQDILIDEYASLYSIRACKARLFSTYGENLRSLAVWEITRRALAGNPEVLGTGDETRDYLYAGDVARAIATIAEHAEFRGEAINIGSGVGVSISTLAHELFRLAGFKSQPRFTGVASLGSPSHWRADTTLLRSLGWEPPSWSRGLPQTVEWIRNVKEP